MSETTVDVLGPIAPPQVHLPATQSSPLPQSSLTLQVPGSLAASTHLPLWHFLFAPQAPSSLHSGLGTQRFASQTKPGLQFASVAHSLHSP